MNFQTKFSRWKGAGQPANIPILLGGDSAPTLIGQTAADNVLTHRAMNINGWPTQRIAIVYKPPTGTLALNGSIFFWESSTETWYRIGAVGVGNILAGQVVYFDALSLQEPPQTGAGILQGAVSQDAVYLLVTDPGAAPDGAHTFAMSADVSNTET